MLFLPSPTMQLAGVSLLKVAVTLCRVQTLLILFIHQHFLFQSLSSKQDIRDYAWKALSLNSSMAPSGFGSNLSSLD